MGPAEIVERQGNQSYKVLIRPGKLREVHASQMKPYVEDHMHGTRIDLFHYLPTSLDKDLESDEWNVEAILRHRKRKDGRYEFLTKWEGYPGQDTWEPLENFISQYNQKWHEYCGKKHIFPDIVSQLGVVEDE